MTEWTSMSEKSSGAQNQQAWSGEEFQENLRKRVTQYHTEHSFHQAMINGELSKYQIQSWVQNRYYYQITIPRKDAAILANCPDQDFRRQWIKRLYEQDGGEQGEGGLEGWIRLGEACGLKRNEITSLKGVFPGVRFACDAYLNFAKQAPWQEAVCSSLTELFAHKAHQDRIESFPKYYPWIEAEGLGYFKSRIKLVQIDVKHGLQITLDYFNTRALQERALDILGFKLDILWSILDTVQINVGIASEDAHEPVLQ